MAPGSDQSDAEPSKDQEENADTSPRRSTRRSRQPTDRYEPPEEAPTRKRKPKPKQYVNDGGNCIDTSGSDADGSEGNLDDARPSKKRPRVKVESSIEDRTCPHCQKHFTVKMGCDYHIKNFVCRPHLRPGGPAQKGKRKKTKGSPKSAVTYKRIRGSLDERTCSKCNRVFTSILGMNYHIEKRVCVQDVHNKLGTKRPLEVLVTGSQFVTSYGVVEVVKDDRATPTAAAIPSKMQELVKTWRGSQAKQEVQVHKQMAMVAVQSLLRRSALNEAYESKQVNQQTVWKAYFGCDPRTIPASARKIPIALPQPVKADPSLPIDSHPYRMVECVLISDERARILGLTVELPKVNASQGTTGTRLFLQRRLLVDPYIVDAPVYICKDCGRIFGSQPGCKYHTKEAVCRTKAEKKLEALTQMRAAIEERFQNARSKPSLKAAPRYASKRATPSEMLPAGRKKGRKLSSAAMYPSVLRSLDFKLVANHPLTVTVSAFNDKRPGKKALRKEAVGRVAPKIKVTADKSSAKNIPKQKVVEMSVRRPAMSSIPKSSVADWSARTVDGDDGNAADEDEGHLVNPETTIRELTAKLWSEKAAMLGAFYPSAFKALKFRKPTPIIPPVDVPSYVPHAPVSIAVQNRPVVKRRRKTTKIPAPPANKPLPPIIDVRVLAGEVESGRYPSVKRIADDAEHQDSCYICKATGALICCDFCTKAVHFGCMRTKFTLPYPEPKDDFMCNFCIQYIMARRARAEKRRLKKAGTAAAVLPESVPDEANRLKREFVEGMEYECVAAQGVETSDLIKLIRDTQLRLQRHTEMSKMNKLRRGLLESSEQTAAL